MLSNPDLVSNWDSTDKTIPYNILFQNHVENSREQLDDTTLQGDESEDDSNEEKNDDTTFQKDETDDDSDEKKNLNKDKWIFYETKLK